MTPVVGAQFTSISLAAVIKQYYRMYVYNIYIYMYTVQCVYSTIVSTVEWNYLFTDSNTSVETMTVIPEDRNAQIISSKKATVSVIPGVCM